MRLQQIKEHRLGHRARMKSCGNGRSLYPKREGGMRGMRESGSSVRRSRDERECPSSGDVRPPVRGMPVLYQ